MHHVGEWPAARALEAQKPAGTKQVDIRASLCTAGLRPKPRASCRMSTGDDRDRATTPDCAAGGALI